MSTQLQLKKATRKQVKLKMSISAPTGFGKTYSSLLLAYGMTGDWTKIAVIDTENESASLYSDLGDYNTVALAPPFTPDKYIDAIRICEQAGMEVIVIDSCYHMWKGSGGLLEYQNSLGGKYQDWAKTTPLYQKWLSAILQSKCHVICTNRKKQSYNMVQDGNRTKVEKAGMEDEIREGFEYEVTVSLNIVNDKHMCTASKDRTGIFDGRQEFVITADTGKALLDWCNTGVDEFKAAIAALEKCGNVDDLVMLKEGLPQSIIKHADFITAATKRYHELNPKA
jgi:hypothetical protein